MKMQKPVVISFQSSWKRFCNWLVQCMWHIRSHIQYFCAKSTWCFCYILIVTLISSTNL